MSERPELPTGVAATATSATPAPETSARPRLAGLRHWLPRLPGLRLGAITLLLFQAGGETIARSMGWPIPGAVIGMVLRWLALCLLGRVPAGLEAVASLLLAHLLLPLIPSVAAIMQFRGVLVEHALAIVLVCGAGIVAAVLAGLAAYRLAGGMRS